MLLPSNFGSIIADHFYDKTVSLLEKSTTSEAGWVDETATTVRGTFKGNVQFNRLADIQAELGLTDQIDVAITCATDTDIKRGDLFSYRDVTYRVTAAVPNDSHLKIAGRLWA